jgi:uncharacterized membrane protein YGL010W
MRATHTHDEPDVGMHSSIVSKMSNTEYT